MKVGVHSVLATNALGGDDVYQSMSRQLDERLASIDASEKGRDYPEGTVAADHPKRKYWDEVDSYQPCLSLFVERKDIRDWGKKAKRSWAKNPEPMPK